MKKGTPSTGGALSDVDTRPSVADPEVRRSASRPAWPHDNACSGQVSPLVFLQSFDEGHAVPFLGQRLLHQFGLGLRGEAADRLVTVEVGGERVSLGGRRDAVRHIAGEIL